MQLKIINGKVYGANLTRKEQEALEIEIRKQLKNARKELETPVYRIARKLAGWFVRF